MLFRYMEALHVSYWEAVATPWTEIERAFFIWSLDKDKSDADSKRNTSS